VVNTINTLLNDALQRFEDALNNAPDPGTQLGFSAKAAAEGRAIDKDEHGRDMVGEEVKIELDEGMHKLETLLNTAIDTNFDKWEIYVLRNILGVGVGSAKSDEAEEMLKWFRLRGYEVRAMRSHEFGSYLLTLSLPIHFLLTARNLGSCSASNP
jgi:kinetochore protein Mis12/MTW1